jgi:hypothetical protein
LGILVDCCLLAGLGAFVAGGLCGAWLIGPDSDGAGKGNHYREKYR